MNASFILLSLSYVLLTALVAALFFLKTLKTSRKLLIISLLPLVYFFHWQALQETRGWPSPKTLPTQFELLGADVVEPDKLKKVKGNIHLWIRPKEKDAPRAYILPYSRDLHKRLFEARKRIRQGRTQLGLLTASGSREGGADIGGGMKLAFRNAPRKRLPPKSSTMFVE